MALPHGPSVPSSSTPLLASEGVEGEEEKQEQEERDEEQETAEEEAEQEEGPAAGAG